MTAIAGLITTSGWGYIAADIGASTDSLYSLISNPKVCRFDADVLMGYAGSIREGRSAVSFLMDTVGNKVSAFERRWTKDEFGETEFLFIEAGRMFEVGMDGAVIEIAPNEDGSVYGAIGSGASTALGSLYVDHIDLASVAQAIDAAIAHVPGIYGPPIVIDAAQK